MTPKVSMCLTSYRRPHAVGKTIEAILRQDFHDWELVIQDDSSGEETTEVLEHYRRMDDRISWQSNPRNHGMPGNLNLAIARSKGAFVAVLHDGDLFTPDMLTRWTDAIEKHEAAFVFNTIEFIDGEGHTISVERQPFGPRLEVGELVRCMLYRYGSPVWGEAMLRRSCLDAVGLFNPRYSFIADVEMWMRLNLRWPVAYVAEPVIKATPHEADRPYAFVNWRLERCHVAMREEIGDLFFQTPLEAARYRRTLRRMRDRRWLRTLLACLYRRRLDLLADGLRLCKVEDSTLLNAAGLLGAPFVALSPARDGRG